MMLQSKYDFKRQVFQDVSASLKSLAQYSFFLESSYRSSGVVLLDEIYRDQRVTLIEDQVPKKDTATSQVRMERSDELCPQTQSSTKTGLGQAHKKRRGSSSGHAVVSDASAHPESKTCGGVESKRHV